MKRSWTLDFSHISPQDIGELVPQLDDLTVDIEGKKKPRSSAKKRLIRPRWSLRGIKNAVAIP
jgi:hypothetical protein